MNMKKQDKARFDQIIRKSSFQARVKRLRLKYGIPEDGYPINGEKGVFGFPLSWAEKSTKDILDQGDDEKNLELYMLSAGIKAELHGLFMEEGFFVKNMDVLFYRLDEIVDAVNLGPGFICSDDFFNDGFSIGNRDSLKLFLYKMALVDEPFSDEERESIKKAYPISIRISASASMAEIKKFLSEHKSQIKFLQEAYSEGKSLKRPRNKPALKVQDLIMKLHEEGKSSVQIKEALRDLQVARSPSEIRVYIAREKIRRM